MKVIKSILIILIVLPYLAQCQKTKFVKDPDVLAQFPGGNEKLRKYIDTNFSWEQSQLTVEGIVYISFIVYSNGEITNINVEKSLCETCDAEAIRLVKNMPNWIPAKKNGNNVSSKMVLPIRFSL